MTNVFTDTINWFSQGKIANIPVLYFFLIIGLVLFVLYLLISRKPKSPEYKAIDMKKEIKRDFGVQYKFFGIAVGKTIYSSLTKIGYAIGYMPMVWNIRKKKYESVFKSKPDDYKKLETISQGVYQRAFKDLDAEQKKGVRNVIKEESHEDYAEIIVEGETAKFKYGKREVRWDETIPVFCFKVCGDSFFSRLLARLLGVGTRYFIIGDKQVVINDTSIQFVEGLQRQLYFDNFVFSQTGKNIVENTSFKINRQSEIQEIGNDVSRTVFWDNEFRKRALLAREISEIEAKKFKSQKESAED
jgi:hypothetical protein